MLKHRLHGGSDARLHHDRESRGAEVDLVSDTAERLVLTEIKSGATVASDWLGPLPQLAESVRQTEPHRAVVPRLVYGGDRAYERRGVQIIPWSRLQEHTW